MADDAKEELPFTVHMAEGGPAFPSSMTTSSGAVAYWTGMSRRDWFAGQALAGMLAHGFYGSGEQAAESAFTFADAMLAARPAPGEGGE